MPNNTLVKISFPEALAPTNLCLPADTFTLAQTGPYVFEYDRNNSSNNVFSLDQATFVSNAMWDLSAQKVHVGLFIDGVYHGLVPVVAGQL